MNEALLAACGGWVCVYPLNFIRFKRKPFSCETCLAGWFTLLLCVGHYPWYQVPFYMSMGMVMAVLITKTINRL